MGVREEFGAAVADGNVDRCWGLWRSMFPNMPQPKSFDDAEKTMHICRSAMKTAPMPARQYSHKWLVERGIPSEMPDKDRQPIEVVAVGIAVKTLSRSPDRRLQAKAREAAMVRACQEAQGNGVTDPAVLRKVIREARVH